MTSRISSANFAVEETIKGNAFTMTFLESNYWRE